VEKEGHLQKVVGEVNRTVCEVCPDTFYAPLFCCYIDTRRRLLHYVNAGHEPALLVRQRTGRAHRLESTGPVLGLTDRAVYGQRSFPVEAGDVLVAFSEGLSAAIAPARIAEIVRERMGGRSIDLVRDVLSAGGDTVLKEDRTVLAARLIGVLGETVPKAHETALVCAA
jgi:sigma-B regulation protein RsbU (phosphoserine phosphatase)